MKLLRAFLVDLPRRAWLTLRYHGLRTVVWRMITFPLRLTPLGDALGLGPVLQDRHVAARHWYRRSGRPVLVVIPSYGPTDLAAAAVAAVRRTTDERRVRVVVVDDGSPPEHSAGLDRIDGAEVIREDENRGFSAAVNRGLRELRGDEDAVILNSDVVAEPGWLESLQYGAYRKGGIGIAGPRLLYPDRRIQSAGSYRNQGAPEWFDHRYRFAPEEHGPANVDWPALAMTGACLYVKGATLPVLGGFDEAYEMGYEDVDLCLRAWEAGWDVAYAADAALVHHESTTRGGGRSPRELRSQRLFWDRWGDWFDRREVRTAEGALRIVYVTEDTGIGGGHRVVFEHVRRLRARGHDVEVWTLEGPPEWFDLQAPVRVFDSYVALVRALAFEDAIKVATWWNTAVPVWQASVRRGVPVYLVQDIETSYYPDHPAQRNAVLATYRQEFRYLAGCGWIAERLGELGVDAKRFPPGLDVETFHPMDLPRQEGTVLAVGRTNPLKNFPLTRDAWLRLREPRPELLLYGVEPEVADRPGMRYVERPSDAEVARLYATCTAFVQTSRHEGFCLPLLEAMATGAPTVSTDAHGNRDFCRDGENCLIVDPQPDAVSAALARLLADPELRARLGAAGVETARRYAWEERIDELERFFESVAVAAAVA